VSASAKAAPKHAARPIARAYFVVGLLFALLAGLMLFGGNLAGGATALALAALSLSLGRSLGQRIVAVQIINTAVQHLTRGDHAEALALLETVPSSAMKSGIAARGAATVRALVALYEGRLDESVQFATTALSGRLGLLTRTFESSQVAAAHAIRGLAFAALGDATKAKADADAAETSVDATPEVIARARLVRALLASRAAYHEVAFRTFLGENARLVLEHAMPRERALLRALRRLARSPQRSVYREPARANDDRAPSKLASWIATVAPEAAAYVEGDRLLADRIDVEAIPSGVPSDVRALRSARAGASAAPRTKTPVRTLVALAAFAAALVATWEVLLKPHGQLDAPGQPVVMHAPESWLDGAFINALPFVLAAIGFITLTSFTRRQERQLSLARRLVALGHRVRARPALESLVTVRNGMVAATAGLELARIAATEAAFAEAISRCDAAIARVHSQPLRAAASDILLPSLMTESAVAMAARGGLEDADAELAVLCRDFPTYPRLASSQLRVRLVRSVRAGDRDAACAMARARTAELPLPYREDVLADLVLASRGELSELDLERLDAELRDDAELRKWIDAVGPGLRDEAAAGDDDPSPARSRTTG
jgi:hypothetical protein